MHRSGNGRRAAAATAAACICLVCMWPVQLNISCPNAQAAAQEPNSPHSTVTVPFEPPVYLALQGVSLPNTGTLAPVTAERNLFVLAAPEVEDARTGSWSSCATIGAR